jgi:16S rRNA (cytosine1402-N4)-methyltransferase
MGSMKNHQPVLLKEVIKFLDPNPNENFIDATFGDGGHSLEILKFTSPNGKILGIDLDQKAINEFDGRGLDSRSILKYVSEPPIATTRASRQNRSGVEPASVAENIRIELICGNFADISRISSNTNFYNVNGILFDLGFRTGQLEDGGFSFQKDEPLDMRYNMSLTNIENLLTAEKIVNEWPEKELERIFKEYGEDRNSKRIAGAIVEIRHKDRIRTSGDLVDIIDKANLSDNTYKFYRVKTLARIFQALRIAVNNELENIKLGLMGAWDVVGAGGRIGVISFHSLEDRIVKKFFVDKKKSGEGEILTKKPIMPSEEEIRNNSKSRSAKMRVIKKI